ncbi:MAG: hypothetical protein Q9220_004706 [cf. Caloplaca sp. 1 TL-2023]
MNPSSALLQDLLREKKASQRASTISGSDLAMDGRQVQSSPIAPPAVGRASKSGARRSSGLSKPNEMGVREMAEHISKIDKQNFDLKLEIFQRRQRNEDLEAKAAKADELQAQNVELQQINDDLLRELEKRDGAVEEAVALICDYEAQIEQMNVTIQSSMRPSTPDLNHDSGSRPQIARDSLHTPESNREHQRRHDDSLFRSPSPLKGTKTGASELKEMPLPSRKNEDRSSTTLGSMSKPSIRSLRRVGSLLSQDEYSEIPDGDTFSLGARRLSLLSESSFLSVYGENKGKITPSTAGKVATGATTAEENDGSFSRTLSPQESRIRQWIQNRDHPASPSRKPTSSNKPNTFSSIGEVLGPDRSFASSTRLLPSSTSLNRHDQEPTLASPPKPRNDSSLSGPMFGPDNLPPTPGTMSTATLGGKSSNHSIVAERSLMDGGTRPTTGNTSIMPDARAYRSKSERQLLQRKPSAYVGIAAYDDDTDIEISDDETHHDRAEDHLKGASRGGEHHLIPSSHVSPFTGGFMAASGGPGSNVSRRPALNSYATDMMFNGEDIDTIRPSRTRTISFPSPARTVQPALPVLPEPRQEPGKMINGHPHPDLRITSQKGMTNLKPPLRRKKARATPGIPRSTSLNSKLSQPPAQTLTSRLFRRNPQAPLPQSESDTAAPEPTSSSSSSRPQRPSSMYMRSTSSQLPSAVPSKVSRIARPGTAGGASAVDPVSAVRRQSGVFGFKLPGGGDEEEKVVPFGDGLKDASQQQSKRRSMGAFIGRSASLRLKEGFGRKK